MPSWNAIPTMIRARFPSPPTRANFPSDDEFMEALGYWQSHVGRNLAFAMQAHRESPRRLLYRVVPHNGGLIFAEPERAHAVALLHVALRDSATWGDFRNSIPNEEFTDIVNRSFVANAEPPPNDADSFNAEEIAGWTDGDYPPWLQKELDSVLPQEIFQAFAQKQQTVANGTYWFIPEAKVSGICEALAARGFAVDLEQNLRFH